MKTLKIICATILLCYCGVLAEAQPKNGGTLSENPIGPGNATAVLITLSANTTPSMDFRIDDTSILVNITLKNLGNQTVSFMETSSFMGGFPICEVGNDGNATVINGPSLLGESASLYPLKPMEEFKEHSILPRSLLPAASKQIFIQLEFHRADHSTFTASSKPVLVGDLLSKKQNASASDTGKTQ